MNTREHCFIITPIGDDTDPIRRHIEGIIEAAIKPALGEKYEFVVAHKISEPGSITKQVINEIYSSKLVIANLTNRNPNVMYELAFRHSLGKPVIMIAEKGTSLPADIIMERTIFYQNDAQGVLELREKIIAAENNIDFGKETSPIYDIIQEHDRDVQILKFSSSNQTDTENTSVLKYILQKLNNLEDSVQSIRPSTNFSDELVFPRKDIFTFSYSGNSRPYQIDKLHARLQKIQTVSSHISVEDVHINENKEEIILFVTHFNRTPISSIVYFFQKTLSEFGFINAKIESINSPIE